MSRRRSKWLGGQWLLEETVEDMDFILHELSERERLVVRGRLGLDGPGWSQRRLGLELGVSGARVGQIQAAALEKCEEVYTEVRRCDAQSWFFRWLDEEEDRMRRAEGAVEGGGEG